MTVRPLDEHAIFEGARHAQSAELRDAYLDQQCGNDAELRNRIEALLRAYDEGANFLESPPPEVGAFAFGAINSPTIDRSIAEGPGTVIGPYKLRQQIGEGGMGVVFMAEQAEPIQRTVALKIIKPGMDTRQVIARFEAERQALAMMDHPNIAKVLDAGTTDSGRPYFVMELVKGVPITKYCDEKQLTLRERLELLKPVCEAVQHAHQKGIIHRDIKPTNVLVAEYDNHAVPKVIDFGVAKATAQKLTERTMFTEFGQVIGTVEYMSPEQAKFNQLDIDTRSDIYSLGVLLYELLTGSTPFEQKRLREAAFDEVLRIIREEEPPKPSTRLSTSETLPSIAANRHTEPTRLSRDVSGELDWIVMKCLEKDRNRRYETANGLLRDMERYLTDEPVQACPPSASYRLKKFIRRNKIAAAFVLLLVAAVAALAVSNIQTRSNERRALSESAKAKAVSDLLQEMLGSADAAQAKGVDYEVRELLDDFSAGLGSQLRDQPEVDADIQATIGRAYRSVKRPDQAQPHFEKAIEIRRRNDGPQSEELAAVMVDGAWNLLDQQRHAEAESQVSEALEIYRGRGIAGGPLFHALQILQHILISAKRDDDAERVTKEALDVARQSGQEFPDQANLLHRYADMRTRQGNFAEAEQFARQAVDMHLLLHGDRHPETAWGLKALARALVPQQKLAEAEKSVREALAIFRRQFPEDHPNVRDTIDQLRTVLEAREDKSALEALAKEEADYAMRSGSPDYHIQLAEILTNQSRTAFGPEDARRLSIAAAARTEEAHRHIRQAFDAYGRLVIDYPNDLDRRLEAIAGFIQVLKVCLAAPGFAGEVDELNRRLEAELPKLVAAFPDSNECHLQSAFRYVDWAYALDRYPTYRSVEERAYRKEIEILEKLSLSDPKRPVIWLFLADAHDHLGILYWQSARPEAAEAAFLRAKEVYDKHSAEIAVEKTQAYGVAGHYVRLAYFLAYTRREDEAAECLRKAADVAKRVMDPVNSVAVLCAMAMVQLRMGDQDGYRETCKALVEVPVADADDLTKARVITAWCSGPDALDDPSLPVKRAAEFAASNSLGQPHVGPFCLGRALYRDSQYERAAEQLEASITAYPTNPAPGYDLINFQQLFLAMTKWQLGQQDEARRLLEKTLPDIDKYLQTPSYGPNQWAELEVLRREAQALIKPTETDEAVKNKSRTNNN